MSTEHDSVNKQIIHIFPNGCRLITDKRTKKAYLVRTDDVILEATDTSDMLVSEYTDLVLNYEKTMR